MLRPDRERNEEEIVEQPREQEDRDGGVDDPRIGRTLGCRHQHDQDAAHHHADHRNPVEHCCHQTQNERIRHADDPQPEPDAHRVDRGELEQALEVAARGRIDPVEHVDRALEKGIRHAAGERIHEQPPVAKEEKREERRKQQRRQPRRGGKQRFAEFLLQEVVAEIGRHLAHFGVEVQPSQESELMLQRFKRSIDERSSPREVAVQRFLSRQRLRGKPRHQRDHHGDRQDGDARCHERRPPFRDKRRTGPTGARPDRACNRG